jgi:hypothetical protein
VRERGPARCYLGNKGGGISFGRRQRGKAATGQRDLANQRFFGPPAIARVGFTHGPPTGANWARGSLTAPKILQWDRLDGFGGPTMAPLAPRGSPSRAALSDKAHYRNAATRAACSAITRALSSCGVPAGSPLISTFGLDHTGRRGQPLQLDL